MEEQLFPRAELVPVYDKAVWLYVYRDFSGDERDRADERIALRFGFSSYPQHKLVDPVSLALIGDTDRSIESFTRALSTTTVKIPRTTDAAGRLQAAEARAIRLEDKPSVKAATAALEDEDLVVRLRALEILAEEEPEAIVRRAEELLEVPSDPVRYATCRALAKSGDTSAARALDAVLADPAGSLNPNVLRMNAVNALARCGDARSVEALAPFADKSAYGNALTRSVVTSMVAIAEREKATRKAVQALLIATFPDPPEDAQSQRIVLALATHVHDGLKTLTGKKVDFPGDYDAKSVAKLRSAWSKKR
jgi:hypothetical protein